MLQRRIRLVAALAMVGAAALIVPSVATAQSPAGCTVTPIDQIASQSGTTTTLQLEVACTGRAAAARVVTAKLLDKELASLEAAADATVSALGKAKATIEGGVTEICVDDPNDAEPPTCITI